jgi:outer membrane receptor protein involved in Fe transport
VNGVFAGYGVAPGTVLNSRSLGFNDSGTLFSQVGAVNYNGPTTGFWSTFGGTVRQPVTMQEYLVQPMERRNFFGKFEYDITDNISAYAQVLHVTSEVTGQVGWTPTVFVIPSMPVTNPFIPAGLRTILASRPNPLADFTLNDRFVGFEDRKFRSDSKTDQYIVGLKGNLPIQDWTFDIYGLHDSVDIVETQDKALLLSKMQTLFYAPDGGRSICAGGFNPFGLANGTAVSTACRNFIETETHDTTETEQDIVEGTISGRMFALPAGDARFSLTGTYRSSSFEFDPDNARENNDIIGTLTTAPSQGSISVREAAVEFLVPILADMPFAKSLDLSLGYRYSDYDVTGALSTYKIDGIWKPIETLSFRGGFERAIRAPNIGELYSSALSAQVQIGTPPGGGDPCDIRSSARTTGGAAVRALCVATGVPAAIVDSYQYTTVAIGSVASGSTSLTPEEADTLTVGAVWRPAVSNPWLEGLSLSVDYYDIEITNVISQVSGVTTMNKCYNLDGTNPTYSATNLYCQLITRDGTGGISTVATPYLNLGGLKTSGFDIQADLRWNLADIGLGANAGELRINAVANFTNTYQVQLLPNTPWTEYAGTIDGTQAATTPPVGLPLPDWKTFVNVTYSNGPAEIGFRWRHLPEMNDVTSVTRPASPAAGVPAYDVVDLNLGWKLSETLALRGGVTNLFDEDPPIVGGTLGQTQPGTYDIIGRSYYVSLSARF